MSVVTCIIKCIKLNVVITNFIIFNLQTCAMSLFTLSFEKEQKHNNLNQMVHNKDVKIITIIIKLLKQ